MQKAVITGDIIHSSRMNNRQKKILLDSIKAALPLWDKDFGMRSELYRGDSFQCLMKDVASSVRMALILKTYIKSLSPPESLFMFDARITIGIGNAGFETNKLATSDGEAFQLSGRELDELKRTKRGISISTNDGYSDELKTESVLLDALLQKTSAFQCEVINLKLLGYTETQIAKRLGVNQSAINQRSNSAGWFAIETVVKRFETIYSRP